MTNPELDSFQCINLASFNTSLLGGTFQPLNGSGFSDDVKILKVYNGSSNDIEISYDGVNPHDYWPAGATLIIDIQANHSANTTYGNGRLNGRAGQIVYGRTPAHTNYLQIAGYR